MGRALPIQPESLQDPEDGVWHLNTIAYHCLSGPVVADQRLIIQLGEVSAGNEFL